MGKSEAYIQRLNQSVQESAKAAQLRDNFLQSIREIESSDSILGFVPSEMAEGVMKIRALLSGTVNS